MQRPVRYVLLAGASAGGCLGACSSDLVLESRGGVGGSGATSDDSSTALSGSTSTMLASECTVDGDCETSSECAIASCVNEKCAVENLRYGTVAGEGDEPQNCHTVVCDGDGAVVEAQDDTDVPIPSAECEIGLCHQREPRIVGATGDACGPDGTKQCYHGACVDCVGNEECSDAVCQGGLCVATHCANGILDGSETDVDCGGVACQGCLAGETCVQDDDCVAGVCDQGKCVPPSCALQGIPGFPQECDNHVVPGGSFNRSNDPGLPATVSSFRLDDYEVTVKRFRTFVAAGGGIQSSAPGVGLGAHPAAPGSGWQPWMTSLLPVDFAGLSYLVDNLCHPTLKTWTPNPGANERRPILCAPWPVAFAFCIWDGARLPTEAEWNYASAGGNEQRTYPWGQGPLDLAHAVYAADQFNTPTDVGALPLGVGKWGQGELAGNVAEFTRDHFVPLPQVPCNDCVFLSLDSMWVARGGSFATPAAQLALDVDRVSTEVVPSHHLGFRCARSR